MKKVVLTFGALSGTIPVMMFVIAPLISKDLHGSLILGWTTIILSAVFIFVGIRSYRENYNNGVISFGKALKVGLLITLIGALMYVLVWEIMYFNFMHDMMDGYFAAEMDKVKASGASAEEIEKSRVMWDSYKNNPLVNAAFTILEPITVTIPVSFIAALIMKQKTKKEVAV